MQKGGSIGLCSDLKYRPNWFENPKRGSSPHNLPTIPKYGSTHPRNSPRIVANSSHDLINYNIFYQYGNIDTDYQYGNIDT